MLYLRIYYYQLGFWGFGVLGFWGFGGRMHGPGRKDGTPEPNKRMLQGVPFARRAGVPFGSRLTAMIATQAVKPNEKRGRSRGIPLTMTRVIK